MPVHTLTYNLKVRIAIIALIVAVCALAIPKIIRIAYDMPRPPQQLNSIVFQQNLASGIHLVDFWASWCAPCRAQDPIIEKVAGDFSGQVKVWKIDVDINKELPEFFGVNAVPTLFVIQNGKVVHRFNGLQSEAELADVLNQLTNR